MESSTKIKLRTAIINLVDAYYMDVELDSVPTNRDEELNEIIEQLKDILEDMPNGE